LSSMPQRVRSSTLWTDQSILADSPPFLPQPGQVQRRPTRCAGDAPVLPVQDPRSVATFVVGSIFLRTRILRALQSSRFVVIGSASDGATLPVRREDQQPSLAIVEAADSSSDLVGLARAIRQRSPSTYIVLAGDFRHPTWLRQPLSWADGLVQSDVQPEVLTASLDLVMLGAAVLPKDLTGLLIEQARRSGTSATGQHVGFDDQRFVDLQIRRLSVTEKAVLECLKDGSTNKIIARRLDLTVSAVTIAMKGILRKLALQNRTQAALWALENLSNDESQVFHEP